jgi:protein-disulfide isomerase
MPTFVRSLVVALVLAATAVALPSAPARADAPFTPEQKAAMDKMIHDYIMAHPEVVIESIRAERLREKEEAAEDAKSAIAERRNDLLQDPTSAVGGNPKGDVTLVEFFDYRCPYCKQVEPSLEALLKEDRNLRIVYKEFPVLGPASVTASRVALAARKQGKYEQFRHAMMTTKGQIDDEVVMRVAQSSGLDMTRLKTDMQAPEIEEILKSNLDLAVALGVQGTPAFVVGDTMAPGAADIDSLRKLIAAARKRG